MPILKVSEFLARALAGAYDGDIIVEPPEPPVEPPIPPLPPLPPNFTWTDVVQSPDTRTFYVSIDGNDANDGLSPATAKRSPGDTYELLRTGFPDWMLLKRGDVWDGAGSQFAFVANGGKSGRSETEPLLIGAYGEGARPVLLGGRFRPLDTDSHIAVVGLEFRQTAGGKSSFAVAWNQASCNDILIEDCLIGGGYVDGIHVVGDDHRSRNVRFRGCVVVDSLSQGVLISEVDGLVFEGCVFDHNGWGPGNPADAFKHNFYITHTNTDVTVRQCISSRASSHGIQQRPGGLTEDNLFLQNPIGIFSTKGRVQHNVVLDSRDLPGNPRGAGIWLNYTTDMICEGNIVAHQRSGSVAWGLTFELVSPVVDLRVRDNIVYDWGSPHPASDPIGLYFPSQPQGTISVTGNSFGENAGAMALFGFDYNSTVYSISGNRWGGSRFVVGGSGMTPAQWTALTGEAATAPLMYPDPDRTIETYQATLGREPTLAAFMAQARKQSRLTWQEQYSARAVCNYIRAGFGLEAR